MGSRVNVKPVSSVVADIDPEVSSKPFATIITDMVGFASFFGIATLWLALG